MTTTPPAEQPIPAGMVPWHGGESAPADWDGGPVMCRDGILEPSPKPGTYHDWRHELGSAYQSDIIAYTPAPSLNVARADEARARELARLSFAIKVSAIERDARLSDLTADEIDSIIDGVLAAGRLVFATRAAGEEVEYEVWQKDAFGDGDAMVAGSTDLADAYHYAAVYSQDAPAWVVEVRRRVLAPGEAGA